MFKTLTMWLLLVLCEVLVVAAFFSPDSVVENLRREQRMTRASFGDVTEQHVRQAADGWFTSAFHDTGIVRHSFQLFIPTQEAREKSTGLEDLGSEAFPWFRRRMETVWNGIYQSLYRFSVLLEVLPFMLPLIIPAIVDGFMTREVKKRTYGYASPIRYYASMHAVAALIVAIPAYLVFPLPVPPLFVPLWAVSVAIILAVMTSNIQKKV
ncbi:MAG: DUF4400 domain-containing protein [Salinisphaeraceae bacterium]|uniref:DUF4400 domain-containing protein n=1 Tax=Spectribacter acetivorans TaxID=3075603 RepID=A0ABU3B8J9_9GAMM|nr:DUF4400 domain-containing protein [Salinisphaera sp. P385]MDT0618569.1 DUF4400 domain-containing protein [Salinisphaera sp. P385]